MTESFRPTVIRNKAWEDLRGKWGASALACLIYMVIVGAMSAIPWLAFLLSLLVASIVAIGASFLWLDVSYKKDVEMKTLFEGFGDYVRYLLGYLIVAILTFLWSLLLIVPGIIKSISYSQTFFIMRENPGMAGNDARKLSMQMMEGHKMEYFLLGLSFIGWVLLGLITCGIGMLWVGPYISTAYGEFYQELKKDWEVRQGFKTA